MTDASWSLLWINSFHRLLYSGVGDCELVRESGAGGSGGDSLGAKAKSN